MEDAKMTKKNLNARVQEKRKTTISMAELKDRRFEHNENHWLGHQGRESYFLQASSVQGKVHPGL